MSLTLAGADQWICYLCATRAHCSLPTKYNWYIQPNRPAGWAPAGLRACPSEVKGTCWVCNDDAAWLLVEYDLIEADKMNDEAAFLRTLGGEV